MARFDVDFAMENSARISQLSQLLERRARVMTSRLPKKAGMPLPEDLSQSVVERLLTAYGTAEIATWSDDKLFGYAYQTLHRLVMDAGIKKREWLQDSQDAGDEGPSLREPVDETPSGEELTAARQRTATLHMLLGKLSEEERRFILLTFELGSAPEAQKTLGWPPGTASNACHRGAKLVKQLMSWATPDR